MKLPFLEDNKWPISKEPEERVVNASYDKQVQSHVMDELLIALEKKDPIAFKEAIQALIYSILDESTEG